MKKNLMSIVILAFLIVNIVLTSILLFSVAGAMKSTTALVSKIAAVLDLELNLNEEGTKELAISDTENYDFPEQMTILLKMGEDEKQHYALFAVSLQLDKTHKDYKKYAETIATNESTIKTEIGDVVSSYTKEEFQADSDGIRNEILTRLRELYKSDFIYKVLIHDVKVQ